MVGCKMEMFGKQWCCYLLQCSGCSGAQEDNSLKKKNLKKMMVRTVALMALPGRVRVTVESCLCLEPFMWLVNQHRVH